MNSSTTSQKKAFTLIELLVVVGVIGILIAILVPTLIGARKQAYMTKCLNNLRQIASAVHVYSVSHKNKFPVNSVLYVLPRNEIREEHTFPLFIALLEQMSQKKLYVSPVSWEVVEKASGSTDVFRCPADGMYVEQGGYQGSVARYTISLQQTTINWQASEWHIGTSYVLNGGMFNKTYSQAFDHRWYGGNTARVKHSSSFVLFGDGVPSSFMLMDWTPEIYNTKHTMSLLDVLQANEHVAQGFRNPNAFDFKRHNKKMNIVFLDGHAETVSISKDLQKYNLLDGKK